MTWKCQKCGHEQEHPYTIKTVVDGKEEERHYCVKCLQMALDGLDVGRMAEK